MIRRIFIDLDEVLVNFHDSAFRVHEVSRNSVEAVWRPGHWCLRAPIGKALGIGELTEDQFWGPIHKEGDSFWEGLEPLPWMDEVITQVERHCLDWQIVTSPSPCPSSYNGKVKWIKKRFGSEFDRFVITPHKEILARPDHLLIDDREANVDRFTFNGGRGLVFPFRGNRLHSLAKDPMDLFPRRLEKAVQNEL